MEGEMRPEFDYWVSFQYGETRYLSPRLNVNGEWIRHTDQYTTYIFGDYAMEFLDQAAKKNNPFVLLLAVNAPHNPVTPALEDESVELTLPERRPNFNEEDLTDKPSWMSMKDDPLAGGDTEQLDLFRRNQILTLIALDRTIEKVLAKLEDTGEMENTMIISFRITAFTGVNTAWLRRIQFTRKVCAPHLQSATAVDSQTLY